LAAAVALHRLISFRAHLVAGKQFLKESDARRKKAEVA